MSSRGTALKLRSGRFDSRRPGSVAAWDRPRGPAAHGTSRMAGAAGRS